MSLMCILLRGPIEIKFPGKAIRKFWICINNKIVSAFFYVNCLKLEEGIKKPRPFLVIPISKSRNEWKFFDSEGRTESLNFT